MPFLRDRLRPVPPPDEQRLRRLLAELDSDDFAIREKALEGLMRMGDAATAPLQRALADRPSPEVRRRVEQFLEQFGRPDWSAERLRALRAIEALEQMASAEAIRALQALAGGVPEALATREAAAAVKRLTRWLDAFP